MATLTVAANGFLSDLSIYSGSPGAAPVNGDTLNIGAFMVYADYSVALASLVTNGGTLIPATGNVVLDVTAATLTGHLKIQGGPKSVEFDNALAGGKVAKGIGGVG